MPPQATTSCGRPEVRFARFTRAASSRRTAAGSATTSSMHASSRYTPGCPNPPRARPSRPRQARHRSGTTHGRWRNPGRAAPDLWLCRPNRTRRSLSAHAACSCSSQLPSASAYRLDTAHPPGAIQQPVGVGGIAARFELPEPDEPRRVNAGVGRLFEADVQGRAEARAGPVRRCALRSGAPRSYANARRFRARVAPVLLPLAQPAGRPAAPRGRRRPVVGARRPTGARRPDARRRAVGALRAELRGADVPALRAAGDDRRRGPLSGVRRIGWDKRWRGRRSCSSPR